MSPSNPGYTVDELAFQLKDSGAKALVTQVSQLEIALKACKKIGLPEDRICLIGDERDAQGRFKHFTSVRSTSGTSRYRRAKVDPANDLAFLVYSSGTTGHPKGVMLTHRNVVANCLQVTAGEGPLSNASRPGFPDGDSILACTYTDYHKLHQTHRISNVDYQSSPSSTSTASQQSCTKASTAASKPW